MAENLRFGCHGNCEVCKRNGAGTGHTGKERVVISGQFVEVEASTNPSDGNRLEILSCRTFSQDLKGRG